MFVVVLSTAIAAAVSTLMLRQIRRVADPADPRLESTAVLAILAAFMMAFVITWAFALGRGLSLAGVIPPIGGGFVGLVSGAQKDALGRWRCTATGTLIGGAMAVLLLLAIAKVAEIFLLPSR